MTRRKHLINVHTSTGTTAPTGASLSLGEIAVQNTASDPALWIKKGNSESSPEFEKFIGETKINDLISISNTLGSGYTYSGIPYVNSSTTIADAYSALTQVVNNLSGTTGDHGNAKIFYGTCSTPGGTAAKVVDCPDFSSEDLVRGSIIFITFDETNAAAVSTLTMNVNETGAKSIKKQYTTSTPANLNSAGELEANQTYFFQYDGTNWVCMSLDYNADTVGVTLRYGSLQRVTTSNFGRYRLMFSSADETKWVPANDVTNTSATSEKIPTTTPIDPFGPIIYYATTASGTSGTAPSTSYSLSQTVGVNLNYSFYNPSDPAQYTAQIPVYLKCTPQSNGSAIIDSTTPLVQTLPTTEDGKIYMFLGLLVSGTSMELYEMHPVYHYKDGAIRLWTNQSADSAGLKILNLNPTFSLQEGYTNEYGSPMSDAECAAALGVTTEEYLNLLDGYYDCITLSGSGWGDFMNGPLTGYKGADLNKSGYTTIKAVTYFIPKTVSFGITTKCDYYAFIITNRPGGGGNGRVYEYYKVNTNQDIFTATYNVTTFPGMAGTDANESKIAVCEYAGRTYVASKKLGYVVSPPIYFYSIEGATCYWLKAAFSGGNTIWSEGSYEIRSDKILHFSAFTPTEGENINIDNQGQSGAAEATLGISTDEFNSLMNGEYDYLVWTANSQEYSVECVAHRIVGVSGGSMSDVCQTYLVSGSFDWTALPTSDIYLFSIYKSGFYYYSYKPAVEEIFSVAYGDSGSTIISTDWYSSKYKTRVCMMPDNKAYPLVTTPSQTPCEFGLVKGDTYYWARASYVSGSTEWTSGSTVIGGGGGGDTKKIFYGTCSTPGGTAAKAVDCPDFSSENLVRGSLIFVTFDATNTAAVSTLAMNVNNTGTKGLRKLYRNTSPALLADVGELRLNQTYLFQYDGTYWVCMTLDYSYSDTDTIGVTLRYGSSQQRVSSSNFARYRLMFSSADGTKWVPANSLTTIDKTTRIPTDTPIDPFGPIIYYAGTSTGATGSVVPTGSCQTQVTNIDTSYSFYNSTSPLSLTARIPVYLKCSPQNDGSAVIDSATPLVQALPSTEDGMIYLFLGLAITTTTMELYETHPVYYYKAGALRLWTNAVSGLPPVTSSDNGKILGVVNGEWAAVYPVTVYNGSETPDSNLGNNGDIYIQS